MMNVMCHCHADERCHEGYGIDQHRNDDFGYSSDYSMDRSDVRASMKAISSMIGLYTKLPSKPFGRFQSLTIER